MTPFDASAAIIPVPKLRDYLLNKDRPRGRSKAVIFSNLGFQRDRWEQLEQALRTQHLTVEPEEVEGNGFGRKFVIISPLSGPTGRTAIIKSVWIVLHGEGAPRLITAMPE